MADFNSSIPMRTQANGDVVVFLADGTVNTQLLSIDASGRVTIKLTDGTGNSVTSQVSGAQRALDVGINVAGVQVDPRSVRALTAADVVTVQQGTNPWVAKDQSDGPVTPGAVASFSSLIGGQFNTVLPTLTTGQQAAIQVDASGRILTITSSADDHNYGVVGAGTLRSAAQIGNATGAADYNYGTVGAQTLRIASQLGNTIGAADFNAGATGTQTLRVTANQGTANATPWNQNISQIAGAAPSVTNALPSQISTGAAFVSATNPFPVVIQNITLGTEVNDYNTVSAVAAAATSNHDYTITATKTFKGRSFFASASGKLKVEVQISADGVTFVSKFVAFNSAATPNIQIQLDNISLSDSGVGSKIRIIRTNKDLLAQDVYSTISGTES